MYNWKVMMTILFILSIFVFTYGYAQSKDAEHYHKEYTFSLAEIEEIKIVGEDTQINVIPTEGNEIRVDISGALRKNQEPIEARQQGSLLKIERRDGWSRFFSFNLGPFNKGETINVYINPEYHKDIYIRSVSKTVGVEAINAKNFSIDTVSGTIELRNIKCDTAKLSTVSGRVTAQNLMARESTVSSTSGDIALSGDMGNLKGNSVSGKFEATYTNFDNSLKIDTISGDRKSTRLNSSH